MKMLPVLGPKWPCVAWAMLLVACAPEPYKPPASALSMSANPPAAPTLAVPQPTPVAPAPRATPARYELEGLCEAMPRTLVSIKSQASGEVTLVRVDVGDSVRKGQVLIEISPRALTEQMQRNALARERVNKRMSLIRVQIAQQKREARVLEPLYSEAGNAKTTLAIGERELELESAQIELRELELSQRGLERELRYTQIQSPGEGVIVKRTVEPGQVVNAAGGSYGGGDSLLELADQRELQLDCAVHADDADLIKQRVPLMVVLSKAAGRAAPVAVNRIAPMIDSKGQVPQLRFTARFAGPLPDGVLLGARYTLQQQKQFP